MLEIICRKDTFYLTNGDSSATLNFCFQAIIDPKTNRTSYYEVFSLFRENSGETYGNEDFLDNLDDQFIKRLATLQLSYIRRKGLPAPPSINVTLSCLADQDFVHTLLNYASLLFAIEITEVDADVDGTTLKKNISMLKKAGIELWLDDYTPTCTRANSTLGSIAWDRIKVSKKLGQEYNEDPHMLHDLLFVLYPFATQTVIFEGIDCKEQANMVNKLNALVQGFYYHSPQSWTNIQKQAQGLTDVSVPYPQNYTSDFTAREDTKRVA